MIRLSIFILGLLMFLVGAASNYERISLPFDCKSIVCSVSTTSFTLDVVLLAGGIFLMLLAWVFHRLNQ